MAEPNPFESPAATGPAQRPPLTRGQAGAVKARDFAALGVQFAVLGGLLLLAGLVVLLMTWWGLIVLAAAVALIATGYALFRVQAWGWYSAAVLVVPLMLLNTLFAIISSAHFGWLFLLATLVIAPTYCFYAIQAVFSRAGRQRYAAAAAARVAVRLKAREPKQPPPPLDFLS